MIIWVVLNRATVNSPDLYRLQQILKDGQHSDESFYSCLLLFIVFPQDAQDFKIGKEIKKRNWEGKR